MLENKNYVSEIYLKRMYDELYNELEREKFLKKNSVILSFLKMRKNNIYTVLKKSSDISSKIPENVILNLLNKNYILEHEGIKNYVLSAQGVWYIEKNHNTISEQILTDFLTEEYFSVKQQAKKVGDKEILILYSMIGMRTFSYSSSVHLDEDQLKLTKWKEILDASCDFLNEMGIITKNKLDIYGKVGNIHPVSSLFRHNNFMTQQTKGIYKSPGGHKYYINTADGDNVDINKLSFLFGLIINKKMGVIKNEKIINHLNNLSQKYNIYVFEASKHQYSMPKYDKYIRDAFMKNIFSLNK